MISVLTMRTLVVLALVQVSSACGISSNTWVTSFSAFEKAILADDAGNVEALVKAFYRANSPFPLSVQVMYHVNSSNGTNTIISTDPDCPPKEEFWLWVPSPVFIFMSPTKLNLYALYTLNYFSPLWTPQVNISVPNVCNTSLNQFNFLNDFTMRVQTYAAASLSSEHGYLGYVLRGCGTDALKSQITATLPDNDNRLEVAVRAMVGFYLAGNICQIVLILLLSVLFLHKCKKGDSIESSDNIAQSSFNYYGLFWGCITMSVLGNVVLTIHAVFVVDMFLNSDVTVFQLPGWIVLAQLVFAVTASLVVAIYYGRKMNFIIPSIFLLPFVFLCCNHAKETSKKIVQCLSIWSLLMFLMHVCCRASFMFLALLARPPVVISTSLLYIFAAFYSVHLLAILFTFAKAKKKQQKRTYIPSIVIDLAQSLALMVVCAAAFCFGLMIGFAGVLANYGAITNSPYSMLSTLITPLALAGLGWALRKVAFQWLKTVTSPNAEEEAEMVPLLQELNQKASLNTEAGDEQVLQARKSTLMEWLMQ